MEKRYITLDGLNLAGKRVLYRGPFNLPVDASGNVVDAYRLKRAIPSLKYILGQGGLLILGSHLGRPGGKIVKNLRMNSVGNKIEEVLKGEDLEIIVRKLDAAVGPDVERAVREMTTGQVILLENTRFYPGEQNCDPKFSRQLASLADIFVYDAPNDMHRRHASTLGVTEYIVSAAGFLMDEEITTLSKLLNPPPGSVLILGGSKIEGKFETIEGLVDMYNKVIIGGAMANTFLAATGFGIGKSVVDSKYLEKVKTLLERYGNKILLPIDLVANDRTKNKEEGVVVDVVPNTSIPQDYEAFDTGPKTNKRNERVISRSRGYIVWNGPFGVFELGYIEGTLSIAKGMSDNDGCLTIILGGDTYAATRAINGFRYKHVLTGGGSSLIYLEKKGDPSSLPGLRGLEISYENLRRGSYGSKAFELVKPEALRLSH